MFFMLSTFLHSPNLLFYSKYRIPGIGIRSKPVAYPHPAVPSSVPESRHLVFLEAPVDFNEAN